MLAMIVAVAENGVIGKDNQLIWRIPEDLKYFRERTTGHVIIMGRKTLESLPFLLPNREHWVITSQLDYVPPYEGVKVFHSPEDAFQEAKDLDLAYCIGGAQVYASLAPYADRLYVTELQESFTGDVTFTEHTKPEWIEIERIPGAGYEGLFYDFVTYERRK